MKEIYKEIANYDYFKNKFYEIFPIQKWNKKTKFLLVIERKKYVLVLDEKIIKKYQIRFDKLGDYFKCLVGLKYLSDDKKIMLLDYYGNGEGKALSLYKSEEMDNEYIAKKIKQLLDTIHENKSDFINVSTKFNCQNWYEFIYFYMKAYLNFVLEKNDISKEDYNFVLELVNTNKNYFNTIPLSYLHGDINEDNICYNKKTKEIYLIDFDDFLVGDVLYEYARMFQYTYIEAFKIIKEKYYPTIETNSIFWLYTFRNQIMEYCFKKANNLDSTSSLNSFNKTLVFLKELTKKQN